MKYRLVMEEEKYTAPLKAGSPDTEQTQMVAVAEISTDDQKVLASSLRGLADKYDPPKTTMRGAYGD